MEVSDALAPRTYRPDPACAAIGGARSGSAEASLEKALTSVLRRATKALEERIAAGQLQYLNLPGTVRLDGGVPLLMVGAIGVSGATSAQDGLYGRAGADALTPPQK